MSAPAHTSRSSRSRRRRLIRTAVGVIAVIVLVSATTVVLQVRRGIRRAMWQENLYQIHYRVERYADDHGGAYPDSLATLVPDGRLAAGVLACDERGDTPAVGPTTRAVLDDLARPGHLSYAYLGRGLTRDTTTDDAVLAYEWPSGDTGGGADVVFGDGRVEHLDAGPTAALVRAVAAATTRSVRFTYRR